METRWLYCNSKDFPALREASKKTCIIPVGSIEKHGLHLPLGTDMLHASVIAYMASQLETVTVAPDCWFGDVPGAQPEGSMTFRHDLMMDMLENLCDQIGNQGYEKILLCNGHGGNGAWLHLFQRRLENKKKPYAVLRTGFTYPAGSMMGEFLLENGMDSIPELTQSDAEYLVDFYKGKKLWGHACLGETAHMMGICPENVHLENLGIESGKSTEAATYLAKAGVLPIDDGWELNYPNFYCAEDPVGCTETIGKASLRIAAEQLAAKIKVLKEDENIMKWHFERLAKLK